MDHEDFVANQTKVIAKLKLWNSESAYLNKTKGRRRYHLMLVYIHMYSRTAMHRAKGMFASTGNSRRS